MCLDGSLALETMLACTLFLSGFHCVVIHHKQLVIIHVVWMR